MSATTHKSQTTFSGIFKWRSLRTRLTIFTLAFFMVGIWSLAFYASQMLREDMQHTLGEQQFSTVSIVAAEINAGLEDRMRALEQVAALITPAMLGNAVTTQTFIEGRTVLKMMFNGGIFVLLHDGTAIADFPLSTGRRGLNFMDRKYASGALREGKTTIGSPVMGKALRSTLFSIATPIHNTKGKVIGALTGTVDLAKPNFLSRITDNSYGKTGGFLLVAPETRTIVYATDKKRIMEVLPGPGFNPLIDRAIKGWEGSGITIRPSNGVEILSSVKGVPVSGWYAAAIMPSAEAFAPIRAMMWRLLFATIFLTMLAGGLTWWMLKRQLAPVFSTIKTLAALSDTDQPPHPLPIARQDEIGELIGGFNHLLETLGQRGEALRESEERRRTLFDRANDGILILSDNGTVIEVNESFARMHGYRTQEMQSIGLNDLDTSGTSQLFHERKNRLWNEGTLTFEVEHYHKDGHVFPLEVSASLISSGGTSFIQCFHRDITDRKRAEEEKVQLEAQLFQAQKIEAIGTLAGGVAHDFNNILAAIIGYTEMAVDENQQEIRQQYLQETLKGAERAKNLVKQILTFSRQDSHEKKPLDIKLLMKESVKFLRASIPATIEIRQQLAAESCNILADPTQMHQIIMNLCTNAAHAMKEAGGILNIELSTMELAEGDLPHHSDLKPGSYIKLTVSDTGKGIDPAMQHRIFDPFFTTKTKDEGTGLGLSVVYGIVKSHDGVITVYSELEKGASFSVYLPRIIHEGVTSGKISGTFIGGTERILFVDDESVLVDLGTRMLSSLGYEVTGITSSMAALDLFRSNPRNFDIVITDMTLPKMTGIDLSREIMQIRPDIPIILCSGIRDPGTEEQVKYLGIRAYLTKPLTKNELSRVIRETLDEQEKQIS